MGASRFEPGEAGNGGSVGAPLSEINVTPFVDVMLVLLIIFIIAAPLMAVGVPVNLPGSSGETIMKRNQPVVVTIDQEGVLHLGDRRVELADLALQLRTSPDMDAETQVLVRGDRTVAYGRIMEVIGVIGSAGFKKVSLLGRPAENSSAAQ